MQDPIAGVSFPKYAAGATLERGGKTYYFIGEETCREFEKQQAGSRQVTQSSAHAGQLDNCREACPHGEDNSRRLAAGRPLLRGWRAGDSADRHHRGDRGLGGRFRPSAHGARHGDRRGLRRLGLEFASNDTLAYFSAW